MSVLRTVSIAVFASMVLGMCAAALTACSDEGGVVFEEPVDAGHHAEAGALAHHK